MIPIFELPYDSGDVNYSIPNDSQMVKRLFAPGSNRKVKYWSIGNEPDGTTPFGYGFTSASQIYTYIKNYAKMLKSIDSTIKIIAPSLKQFNSTILKSLLTVGGAYDITGKVTGHTYCYVDYIDFHCYPFNGTQTSKVTVYNNMLNNQGFRDNLDSLSKWCKTASTSTNRGSNPLKIAITEFNVAYQNASTDGFTGLGTNSFIGGQFWAEAMRYCLRDSVAFINFWSVIEGTGVSNGLGYLPWNYISGTKNPTYYHFTEMATHMKGNYIKDTSNKPKLKAIASLATNQIAVMVLNEDTISSGAGTYTYTCYLDFGASTSGNWLKIDAAKTGKTYVDTIEYMSSTLLLFDCNGNISSKKRYRYSQGSGQNGFQSVWAASSPSTVYTVDAGADQTVCCPGPCGVTFTATPSPNTGLHAYLWYKDHVSTGVITQTYSPSGVANHTHTITVVMSTSGCSTQDSALYIVGNGPGCQGPSHRAADPVTNEPIVKSSGSAILSLVPNPAVDQISIYYSLTDENSQAEIVVVDVYGKIAGRYKLNSRSDHHEIDCRNLTAGIYSSILLINGKPTDTKKLVLMKQ